MRIVFGFLGITYLVVAFARSWPDARDFVRVSLPAIAASLLLAFAAAGAAGCGWASLLSDRVARARLIRDYLLAQPAKYVPGGILQQLGQVALARDAGTSWGAATAALGVQIVCAAASGLFIGAGVLLAETSAPILIRLTPVGVLLVAPLLYRPLLVAILGVAAHIPFLRVDPDSVPSQRRIIRCMGWLLASTAASAAGFALLLGGITGGAPFGAAVTGYALAWVIGYLAVPVPTGVGVREGVLVLILGGSVPSALIIGAAVVHRLVTLAAELALLGVSRFGEARDAATTHWPAR